MTVAPLIAMKSTKCESLEAVGKGTPHAHIWIAPVIRGEDGHDRLCDRAIIRCFD